MNIENLSSDFPKGALRLHKGNQIESFFIKESKVLNSDPISKIAFERPIVKKTIFLPENFDAHEHLCNNPPEGFRPSIDRIHYIVGLLIEMPYRNKNLLDQIKCHEDEIPFIRLSSQLLKKKIHNYDSYLQYLLASGVLETDNHYNVGKFSKGYRLSKMYRTKVKSCTITDSKILLEHSNRKMPKEKYSNLISWFDGLQFDRHSAVQYLDKLFKSEINHFRNKEAVILKHNTYRIMVERMAGKEYFFNVDSYSNRFHTILTNLKSDLRNFISFNDKKLISVDLSGSQPFLILNLLSSDFYDSKNNWFSLKTINHSINPLIYSPPPCAPINSIMCGSFEDKNAKSEIELYKRLVKNNEFYEYCMEVISRIEGQEIPRSRIKTIIFSVLFSSNDDKNPFLAKNKNAFKRVFPFISSVLEAWKAENSNNLAKVLQKIESYLFLDCIAERINREKPYLPIFTVHDSVVTIKGEENYVKNVMFDEIQKRTGYYPHFKDEIWKSEF